MGEEFGPLAHEVHPATQEIAGGAHPGGIDVGHGDHAAAEEDGDLVGVDPVVLGFAAVDGLHVEGVAKDEGNPLPRTQVSEPVPGEHALGGHGKIRAVRRDDLEERFWDGAGLPVGLDGSRLVEITDVQGSGKEIGTAVGPVLLGVESHCGLLLSGRMPLPSLRSRLQRRRPQ
jgi:hypothetical protein